MATGARCAGAAVPVEGAGAILDLRPRDRRPSLFWGHASPGRHVAAGALPGARPVPVRLLRQQHQSRDQHHRHDERDLDSRADRPVSGPDLSVLRLRRESARHRRRGGRGRHRDLSGRRAESGKEIPRPRPRLLRDLRAGGPGARGAQAGRGGRRPAPGRQGPADGAAADVPHVVDATGPRAVFRRRAPQGRAPDRGDASARVSPECA